MNSTENLWQLSACETVDLLRSGKVSVEEAYDSIAERAHRVNHLVNALPTIVPRQLWLDSLTVNQDRSQHTNILFGLPVAIKDLTNVAGIRTTYGSTIFKDFVPEESDQSVRLLEARGGCVFAKSNTPEFGTGGITFNDVFGTTRTPYNTAFSSGGSSGGAAAALAAGCAWLSQGSDMAGSLRTPAAFCGVTSLRPSPGRIRADSADTPFGVLGQSGPMARNVEDLGLFADAIFAEPVCNFREAASQPLLPQRVAVSHELGITAVDESVADAFGEYAESLRRADIEVVSIEPDLSGVHRAFDILRACEYAVGLESLLNEHPGVMKPEVEWNIRSGLALTAREIREALRTQGSIVQTASEFMGEYDLLICPATSVSSVDAELRYPGCNDSAPVSEYYRWLAIAYATTMTALPVLTIPYAKSESGVPLGVQLVGKPWDEKGLFHHAAALEKLGGWDYSPIDPVRELVVPDL